jgi:hypothetical protein
MNSPKLRLANIALLASLITSVGTAADPIRVGRGVPQLLVDDALIQSQVDVKRTLHQPVKEGGGNVPLIVPAAGKDLQAYGSIVYDPRIAKYVMFMKEHMGGGGFFLSTSTDGLRWDQTDRASLVPVVFDTALEPDPGAKRMGLDLFSCYYNAKDPEYPYQGWLFFANYGLEKEGIYFVRSRDGRKWERGRQIFSSFGGPGDTSSHTIRQDGKTVHGPGDVTIFNYDALEDRYLGIFKFYRVTGRDRNANGYRSRAYMFLDRLDAPVDPRQIKRIALLPSGAQARGDTPWDEYYASTAWRYGSHWLGGLKIYHAQGNYPYSAAGCAFLKFTASRDGLDWSKAPFANDDGVPEVFLANGPEGGNGARNDGGYICEFSQGPLRIADELIYYYSATSYGKKAPAGRRITGGGIFRARLRVDGFVSVDWGTLTTRPLAVDSDRLFVNSTGPLEITVLNSAGNVMGQTEVSGDSIRNLVSFDGKSLRQLAGTKPIRLRFDVPAGSRLYSFTGN